MLLEYFIPAFLIGLGGSLHCIGMCGPLMFSSLISNKKKDLSYTRWMFYQAGRISIYVLWGVFFGTIGISVKWFGFQQNISLSLGIAILTILIITKAFPSFERKISSVLLTHFWKSKLSTLLQKQSRGSSFIVGILNGILPCGLVYVALAGATSLQDPIKGGLFMLSFGLGTLPLISAMLFWSNNLQLNVKKKLTRWYPALIGIIAIMLIIRGMNLGNFFSPAMLPDSKTLVHCEAK